jgi:hypothetical protein
MPTTTSNSSHHYLDDLAEKWPSSNVARKSIKEFSGGHLSPKSMANKDAQGIGPPRMRIGRQTVYPVKPLIAWLKSQLQPIYPELVGKRKSRRTPADF